MYSDPLSWQHGLVGYVLLLASTGVFLGGPVLARLVHGRHRQRH